MASRLVGLSVVLLLIAASCTSTGSDSTAGSTAVAETTAQSTAPGSGLSVTLTDVSELVKAVEASVGTVTQTQLHLDDLGGTEDLHHR